jgi:putative transposase
LSLLEELAPRTECRMHALVLMTNHIHLLLTPERPDSASSLMKHLGQRYTQYFNRKSGRTGTLWEGRYRSCLAESAEYVLACYRYIEMNPVRAGMVSQPRDYRWSSHGANALGHSWPLISPHAQYRQLASDDASRQAAYRALFVDEPDLGLVNRIRAATRGNVVLGAASFAREVENAMGRRVLPGTPGRPRKSGTDPNY